MTESHWKRFGKKSFLKICISKSPIENLKPENLTDSFRTGFRMGIETFKEELCEALEVEQKEAEQDMKDWSFTASTQHDNEKMNKYLDQYNCARGRRDLAKTIREAIKKGERA